MGLHPGWSGPYKTDVKKYAEEKVDILKNQFCINLTIDEERHLRSLPSALDMDGYARKIILEKL